MTTRQRFDQAKSEAFLGRLLGDLNGAAVMIQTSIGHRTGLFDAMAELDAVDQRRRSPQPPASTSATSASGSARW